MCYNRARAWLSIGQPFSLLAPRAPETIVGEPFQPLTNYRRVFIAMKTEQVVVARACKCFTRSATAMQRLAFMQPFVNTSLVGASRSIVLQPVPLPRSVGCCENWPQLLLDHKAVAEGVASRQALELVIFQPPNCALQQMKSTCNGCHQFFFVSLRNSYNLLLFASLSWLLRFRKLLLPSQSRATSFIYPLVLRTPSITTIPPLKKSPYESRLRGLSAASRSCCLTLNGISTSSIRSSRNLQDPCWPVLQSTVVKRYWQCTGVAKSERAPRISIESISR